LKILFIFPNWTSSEDKQIGCFSKKAGVYPPINLAILASYAEREGHTVKIVDAESMNLSNQQILDISNEYQPDVIGMTASTPFYHITIQLGGLLRFQHPDAILLLGGPHITVTHELPAIFDYGFIGESDNSFPEFLQAKQNNQGIANISGLLYHIGDATFYTGDVNPAKINNVPFPAWHLLDMNNYYIGTLKGNKNFASIMTIRGCPFNCIFCSTKVYGNNIRRRHYKKVVDEIQFLYNKYSISHFIFLDDVLTLDREHIINIAREIIKRKLDITFEGSTRANLVDDELINILHQAGLIRLSFGLESVNTGIRKTMKKNVPLDSYINANRITNSLGIETLNSCMIGLPGETVDTVRETLSFIRDNKEIKQANISIAVPYPGTELYKMALNHEKGMELVDDDISHFIRYNKAVIRTGDLNPDDLVSLQNASFASIYISPHRWRSVICKSGWMGWLMTWRRLIRCIWMGNLSLVFVNRKYWRTR